MWTYKGGLNTTKEGYTCSSWTNNNGLNWPSNRFPDGNNEKAGNMCRNPDNDKMPWCYVTDPGRHFDYCDIPSCGKFANPNTAYQIKGPVLNYGVGAMT